MFDLGALTPEDRDLLVLEQQMRLVKPLNGTGAFTVPVGEDWNHDTLDEASVYTGTIYADDAPFVAGLATVSGYFQDVMSGRWVRVDHGRVALDEGGLIPWVGDLAEFPELMAQLQEAMEDPVLRALVEEALTSGNGDAEVFGFS